ncbi:C2 domain-containing protein [Nannocystis bainbridge]|uniref:C2 domain-containing protein n=1 Tax=Nannocystis bainbridge TaxID=2995303 RepID=A0ABT5DXH4_9BACT|nr:C2 domain-containing protein [Nannocystis bainbridge]MDC0717423.1 C2 domain-containing protein [Nannocystis bainbridge]
MLPTRMVLVLPTVLVLGCALFAGPGPAAVPSEPQPAAPEPGPAPPVSATPAAPAEAPPAPEPVEIAALRAALGQTAESPAVRELVERMGAPIVGELGGDSTHIFPAHAVGLRFGSDGRVLEVALIGPRDAHSGHYRGALPGGLQFGMPAYLVARSLGVEIPNREYGRRDDTRLMRPAIEGGRTFRAHGLRVRFDRKDWALAVVFLLPTAAPGSVHLDDPIVFPGEESGLRGLRVYYHLGVGASPTCEPFDVELRLTGPSGAPVRARLPPRRARPAVFTAVDERVPCRDEDRMIFVPFGDLDLPPGPHALSLQLATRPAKDRTPRSAHVGAAELRTSAEFEMPAVALVRLRVSRAEIQREVFRRRNTAAALTFGVSALFSRPKLGPDPFWVLVAGRHHHRSKARRSTFSPRWTEPTAWFPLAEGDSFTLHLADEDVGDNEPLAKFSVSLDQLRAAVRDHAPLSAGWVERLDLDGSEIREAGEPAPRR